MEGSTAGTTKRSSDDVAIGLRYLVVVILRNHGMNYLANYILIGTSQSIYIEEVILARIIGTCD